VELHRPDDVDLGVDRREARLDLFLEPLARRTR
jgi:hypothetical protein